MVRGVETKSGEMPIHIPFVLSTEEKALKIRDAWVVEKTAQRTIKAKNRYTNNGVSIPTKVLRRGISIRWLDKNESHQLP